MKIICLGDSTMQFNNIYRYPQFGWPQVLSLFIHPNILILDLARNGKSTKTYIDEGRFADLLKRVEKGDYVICQFGHNDGAKDKLERYTTPLEYKNNLLYISNEIKKKGANFILATPITRHIFFNNECIESHKEYRKTMLELAEEESIDIVDLDELTRKHYTNIGEKESEKYHMIFGPNVYSNYKDGLNDHTHLTFLGAMMVCQLFVKDCIRQNLSISKYILKPTEVDEFDRFMEIGVK